MINVMEWETFLFFCAFSSFNFVQFSSTYTLLPACVFLFAFVVVWLSARTTTSLFFIDWRQMIYCFAAKWRVRLRLCLDQIGNLSVVVATLKLGVCTYFFALLSYWMPRGCQKNVILGTVKQINIHLFLN